MNLEKFCLKCLREIIWDTTEHHYCCECFAVRTMPDEDGMPNLEHVPNFWIETEAIPGLMELYEVCRKNGEQLPRPVFDVLLRIQTKF
jgi:hypothetical protein